MIKQPIIIVGAGPAGLLAAGRAGSLGAPVVLLEKNNNAGKKLLITGKGRCNVTNNEDISGFIDKFSKNGQFLFSAFRKFSNLDLQDLLTSLGVPLKVERGDRVFPESDKALDILKALFAYIKQGNVDVRYNQEITDLVEEAGKIKGVRIGQEVLAASTVIVTTGGKSYPATGSTGEGYEWAKEMGHTITPLKPALVPLNIKENWVKELQGLSLKNVEVELYQGQKLLDKEFGEMLFTHFGVSGPIILTLSRKVTEKDFQPNELSLKINLKPALNEQQLDQRIQRDFHKYQRKQLQNSLKDLLPSRLIPVVIKLSDIDEEKYVHQITKEERHNLLKVLTGMPMSITGPRSLAEAIVTKGGISLKEINPKTMESKLIEGLYFAGEILDIDGVTGGYNLQAAFSTGYTAGESAAYQYLSED